MIGSMRFEDVAGGIAPSEGAAIVSDAEDAVSLAVADAALAASSNANERPQKLQNRLPSSR